MIHARLALLFLLYLAIDLSNPLVPGVFAFDPDETQDVIRDARVPLDECDLSPALTLAAAGQWQMPEPATLRVLPAPIPRMPVAARPARSRSAPGRERPSPSEDH